MVDAERAVDERLGGPSPCLAPVSGGSSSVGRASAFQHAASTVAATTGSTRSVTRRPLARGNPQIQLDPSDPRAVRSTYRQDRAWARRQHLLLPKQNVAGSNPVSRSNASVLISGRHSACASLRYRRVRLVWRKIAAPHRPTSMGASWRILQRGSTRTERSTIPRWPVRWGGRAGSRTNVKRPRPRAGAASGDERSWWVRSRFC